MLGPCKDMPCGLAQLNGLKQGLDSDLASSPDIIRSNITYYLAILSLVSLNVK